MAVAPASSSSSSSSTSTPAKHDVFLSFRGEDTRARFTSHLLAKLSQKNVETFIDNRLSKGDEISPALIEAIRRSRISIIIFSENYAFSSWCLDEVVCILKCKKKHGQTIVPVFYDIEPSLVRRQLHRGQPAFEKHMQEKAACKVEEWKNALIEAASISGWDSQTHKGTEAEFVEDIAKDILAKLNEMYSSSNEFKGLVGIDKNIMEMKRLLRIDDSTTVRMIGIWGMGGLGKTTLARVLFKQLSSEFEGCCFLANVREESGKRDGLESLEKKLFSELLGENDLKTISILSREKLHCKKVLIVLDDVDNPEQLEVFAADHDRFGPGSRVILTTRGAEVLRDRVDEKYELKKLGSDDSLQLFIAHAFKSNYTPTAEDVILSKRVVNYADGNPLALKVLGPLFRSKRKETWETELEKLTKFPNKRIHNILKVSFDGLDETEKAIFLDIACLFRIGLATCRKYVERILSVHRSYVNIGIDCLIEKSLIAVKDHNNLAIHDLLRKMGWEIERQQCERTRLWDEEHLYHVVRNNKETSNVVEGISCHIGQEKRDWSPTMFQGMHRLWLLHIPIIFSGFPQGLQYLPDSLKCLIINYCPWKSLPSHFMAPNLVELRMPGSKLEQLWSGVPNLGNLKYVDLSHSKYLTEISALSQAPNLVSVDLSFCESLHQVPPLRFQIGDKLTSLDQSHNNCYYGECRTLGHLKLDYCIRLKVVERISGNLEELHLSNSTSIEDLSSSICTLYDLEYLNLCNCRRLKSLPGDMQMLKSLTRLDLKGCSSVDKLPVLPRSLIELDLTGTSIEEMPSSSIEHFFGREKLTLHDCKRLKSLPSDMQMLKSLKHLDLKGCSSFDRLPVLPISLIELDLTGTAIEEVPSSSIEHLFGLKKLTLHGCKRLKSLPSNMQMLKSLTRLDLKGCSSFEKLPVLPRSLIELDLTGTSIEEVPSSSIELLFGRKKLTLHGCERIKSLPSDTQMLKSLTRLDLNGCSSFDKLPVLPRSLIELDLTGTAIEEVPSSSIEHLFGLKKLMLHGCKRLKSLPSDMQMLKSLTRLDLKGCSSFDKLPMLPRSLIELDLTGTSIEEVPSSSIEHLFGLKKLTLHGCKRLKSLPSDMQMLKSLPRLDLKGCSSFDNLPVLPRSLIELDLTRTSIEEVPSSSIEHLFGLEKLTLYGCKSLKSLPTGICKLKSLKELELTHCKNLEIFPAIKNLSKLIALLISNCKMLKSLPELPLSLELLDASGCTSLGRIANSRDALLQGLRSGNHVITSTKFFYVDCLNLDQNMCNNIVSEFQLRTLDMSTKSVQPHVGLNTSDPPCVSIWCPGNKIPMWFTHQSESASINIRLSPDWKNTNFLGFASCVVVANGGLSLILWCKVNFITNNGKSDKRFWYLNGNDTEYLDSNSSNLFMWYKPVYYHNRLDIADVSFCFSAGARTNKVRACGVRPLYLQDAKELDISCHAFCRNWLGSLL